MSVETVLLSMGKIYGVQIKPYLEQGVVFEESKVYFAGLFCSLF